MNTVSTDIEQMSAFCNYFTWLLNSSVEILNESEPVLIQTKTRLERKQLHKNHNQLPFKLKKTETRVHSKSNQSIQSWIAMVSHSTSGAAPSILMGALKKVKGFDRTPASVSPPFDFFEPAQEGGAYFLQQHQA